MANNVLRNKKVRLSETRRARSKYARAGKYYTPYNSVFVVKHRRRIINVRFIPLSLRIRNRRLLNYNNNGRIVSVESVSWISTSGPFD